MVACAAHTHVANRIEADGAQVIATALARMPRLTALDVGGTGGTPPSPRAGLPSASLRWVPHPVCSLLSLGNLFALSDSTVLSSVLAGLTDLVELNLRGTPTFHDRAERTAQRDVFCPVGCNRFLLGVRGLSGGQGSISPTQTDRCFSRFYRICRTSNRWTSPVYTRVRRLRTFSCKCGWETDRW